MSNSPFGWMHAHFAGAWPPRQPHAHFAGASCLARRRMTPPRQPHARGHLRTASSIAALAAVLALQIPTAVVSSTPIGAKTPGKTYCFHGHCHRVRTLEETRRAIGTNATVKASFYDDPKSDRFNPTNITSSGEWFRADKPDNAASPIWPDGTRMLVWNPANKRSAVVRINNAGPYWGPRSLDVSRAAAEKLGFVKSGVATLHTKILSAPTPAEATYRKGRQYAAVPGFLGVFESIDKALLAAGGEFQKILAPTIGPVVASAEPAKPAVVKPVKLPQAKPEPAKADVSATADAKAAKPTATAAKPEPKVAMVDVKAAKPVETAAKTAPKVATVKVAKPTAKPEAKPEPKVAKAEAKPAIKVAAAPARRAVDKGEAQPEPTRQAKPRAVPRPVVDDEDRPARKRVVTAAAETPQRRGRDVESANRSAWRPVDCQPWFTDCVGGGGTGSASTRAADVSSSSGKRP